MDLQEVFPNEGEIAQVAKAEECGPSKLLLRAVREQRGKLFRQMAAGCETLTDQELRAKAAKAAALDDVIGTIEQAKRWAKDRAQTENDNEANTDEG